MEQIYREITPLEKDRIFFAKFTPGDPMTFPVHFHSDFEITLMMNANGKRLLGGGGSSIKHFEDLDLVLIFPDLIHGYVLDEGFEGVDAVVVQFSKELRNNSLMTKENLSPIGRMLSTPCSAIDFPKETALAVKDRLLALVTAEGIERIHLFLDILYTLSLSKDYKTYSAIAPALSEDYKSHSRDCERINKIIMFIEKNYTQKISLKDIGESVQMSPSSLSRFFLRKTECNLWDYLSNYRIDEAVRRMITLDEYIFETCFAVGFNNISNFNRAFKKRLGISPSAYRKKVKAMIR